MLSRFFSMFLLVTAASPSAAESQTPIAAEAMRCWPVTTMPAVENFEGKFEVALDADGTVQSVSIVSFEPSGERSRQLAVSAVDAIKACQPYKTETATKTLLTFRYSDMQ